MYKHFCYPFDLSLVAARADHVFSETRTHPTPLGEYDDTAGAVRRLIVLPALRRVSGVPSPSSALGPLAGGRHAAPGGRSPSAEPASTRRTLEQQLVNLGKRRGDTPPSSPTSTTSEEHQLRPTVLRHATLRPHVRGAAR